MNKKYFEPIFLTEFISLDFFFPATTSKPFSYSLSYF